MMFTVLPLQYCHLAAALLHFFVTVSVSGKAVRPEYRCCSILRRAFRKPLGLAKIRTDEAYDDIRKELDQGFL